MESGRQATADVAKTPPTSPQMQLHHPSKLQTGVGFLSNTQWKIITILCFYLFREKKFQRIQNILQIVIFFSEFLVQMQVFDVRRRLWQARHLTRSANNAACCSVTFIFLSLIHFWILARTRSRIFSRRRGTFSLPQMESGGDEATSAYCLLTLPQPAMGHHPGSSQRVRLQKTINYTISYKKKVFLTIRRCKIWSEICQYF